MTTHLYTLGGPPDAIGEAIALPWVAEALDHEDLQAMTPTGHTSPQDGLGDREPDPVGASITVRHTSRLVYQAPNDPTLT